MRELSALFIMAKKRYVYDSLSAFELMIDRITRADKELVLDWDTGVPEEWARFADRQFGIVCMINIRIGIAFIREKEIKKEVLEILAPLLLVNISSYSTEEWCIDLDALRENVPEICWDVSDDVINIDRFSLYDLYWATVS